MLGNKNPNERGYGNNKFDYDVRIETLTEAKDENNQKIPGWEAYNSLCRAFELRLLQINELKNANYGTIEEVIRSRLGDDCFNKLMSGEVETVRLHPSAFLIFGPLVGLIPVLGSTRFHPEYHGSRQNQFDYTMEEFADMTWLDDLSKKDSFGQRVKWRFALIGRALDYLIEYEFQHLISGKVIEFSFDSATYNNHDLSYWHEQKPMRNIWDELDKEERGANNFFKVI